MGAWGAGNFENDTALDWSYDVETDGLTVVSAAIRRLLDSDGSYLDADVCCHALAAAEVVAALRGKPSRGLPEDLETWVDENGEQPTAALVGDARTAAARILARSELRELWEDSPSFTDWVAEVEGLQARLA